jgi:hypothetical protein
MDEDPQIVPADAELPANFVFGLVVQKGSEDGLVALRELCQKLADQGTGLLGDGHFFDVDHFVLNLKMTGFEGDILGTGAVVLQENVVANGIDEGAEALGVADRSVGANGTNHARERFLAKVVDGIGRKPPGAELQLEKLRKVVNKMTLRRRVSFPQAPKIGLVEIEKFQNSPEVLGSIAVTGRSGNGRSQRRNKKISE